MGTLLIEFLEVKAWVCFAFGNVWTAIYLLVSCHNLGFVHHIVLFVLIFMNNPAKWQSISLPQMFCWRKLKNGLGSQLPALHRFGLMGGPTSPTRKFSWNPKRALCCVCILMSSNKSNLLALHSVLLCLFKYMAGPTSANRAIIPRLATGGFTLVTVLSSKDLIQLLYLWCR